MDSAFCCREKNLVSQAESLLREDFLSISCLSFIRGPSTHKKTTIVYVYVSLEKVVVGIPRFELKRGRRYPSIHMCREKIDNKQDGWMNRCLDHIWHREEKKIEADLSISESKEEDGKQYKPYLFCFPSFTFPL